MKALSTELELAAACAAWPATASRDERVRAAASRPMDWQRFLRVVDRHDVVGLVHAGLSRAGVDMPEAVSNAIDVRATEQATRNLTLATESVRLQQRLERGGVELLFLKGAALAVRAFGNLGLRASKDIDLVVPEASLHEAGTILEDAGYRRVDPSPDLDERRLRMILAHRKDMTLLHPGSGVQIELHWRLFLNPFAMNDGALATQTVRLSGTTGLRTLDDEDLFAYLCLHGAFHSWNRLKWLADICALLSDPSNGGVERYGRAADERGAERAAGQARLLCEHLFGVAIPETTRRRLAGGRGATWLVNTALSSLGAGEGERDPHELRFGTTRGTVSALLFRSGWGYYRHEFLNLLFNERDIAAVPLPRWLSFLYPLLRLPLWIWRHVRLAWV